MHKINYYEAMKDNPEDDWLTRHNRKAFKWWSDRAIFEAMTGEKLPDVPYKCVPGCPCGAGSGVV